MGNDDDKILSTANRIANMLEHPVVLVGGMAVCAWGYVRATRDIDLVSPWPAKDIVEKFREAGVDTILSIGDFSDPVPWTISGSIDDVPFQILPPLANMDIAKSMRMEGLSVLLVDLFDLLKMKLYAGGPRDILDVAELVRANPDIREIALRTAKEYDLDKKLESCLFDLDTRDSWKNK